MISRALWAGAPGTQEHREVEGVDVTIRVKVGWVAGVRAPGTQEHREIGGIDVTIAIDITQTIRAEG